jgi:hypothetical protein
MNERWHMLVLGPQQEHLHGVEGGHVGAVAEFLGPASLVPLAVPPHLRTALRELRRGGAWRDDRRHRSTRTNKDDS